jgi:cell division protein FtsZ
VPPAADEDSTFVEPQRRRWLVSEPAAAVEEEKPAPRATTGATLFERMSNIARGAAKGEADTGAAADPLDIPRFLNRQNNQ